MSGWLDLLILSLVAVSAAIGWRRGLVRQFFDVVAVIASYVVALRYGRDFIMLVDSYIPLFRWLPVWLDYPTPFDFTLGDILLRLFGFFVLYALARLVFRLLAEVVHGIFSLPVLGTLNSFGGLAFGLLKGLLLSLILVAVAQLIGTPFWLRSLRDSLAATYITDIWPVVYQQMVRFLVAEATAVI